MKPRLLFAALIAAAFVAPVFAEEPRISLYAELEAVRASANLPGLAIAVVHGEAIVAADVAGVRGLGEGQPILLTDRFHIASVTKSMTATLAAILVEEGRIRWTDTLSAILPELAEAMRAEYRDVTLEQLLAHTARIPGYTQFGPERLEELKAFTGTNSEQRLAFLRTVLTEEPNTGTGDKIYSNAGYTAAGAMLERAAGESWEDLIRTRLAEPLGLTSLVFGWPATPENPDQPRGHSRNGDEEALDSDYRLPPCLWPAGAVSLSIEDVARYARDHLNGLNGRAALLPQAAYVKLHTPVPGASGFALGWGVLNDETRGVIHHGAGSGGTFFVRIRIFQRDDIAIVTASNSGGAGPATLEITARALERFD